MADESSVQQSTEALAPRSSKVLNVLVVDDSRDNAESIATLVRHFGHQVEVASGGRNALQAARLRRPDAVLLDIAMPGMSGFELAESLRGLFPSELLLIAITGEDVRDRCLEAGFNYYFLKPADAVQLRHILSDWASPTVRSGDDDCSGDERTWVPRRPR